MWARVTSLPAAFVAGALALAVTACSTTSRPEGTPPPASARPAPTQVASPAPRANVFTCSTAHGLTTPRGRSALVLGPLDYAGAADLPDLTLAGWTGDRRPRPDAEGWYFVKTGAELQAGRSVTVRLDPRDPVRLVGAQTDRRFTRVRYQACADRRSWWVGGFVLHGTRSACLHLRYTSRGRTHALPPLSVFGGRC